MVQGTIEPGASAYLARWHVARLRIRRIGPAGDLRAAFPKPDARPLKLSSGGGIFPRWRGDSRELFYVTPDNKVMSVTITPAGDSLHTDSPRLLFEAPKIGPPTMNALELFDVAPDGQ